MVDQPGFLPGLALAECTPDDVLPDGDGRCGRRRGGVAPRHSRHLHVTQQLDELAPPCSRRPDRRLVTFHGYVTATATPAGTDITHREEFDFHGPCARWPNGAIGVDAAIPASVSARATNRVTRFSYPSLAKGHAGGLRGGNATGPFVRNANQARGAAPAPRGGVRPLPASDLLDQPVTEISTLSQRIISDRAYIWRKLVEREFLSA